MLKLPASFSLEPGFVTSHQLPPSTVTGPWCSQLLAAGNLGGSPAARLLAFKQTDHFHIRFSMMRVSIKTCRLSVPKAS